MANNKAKILGIILILAVSIGGTVIIIKNLNNNQPPQEEEIKDMLDRTINVPENIEHIVGIGVGALRFISYFGKGDMVVATESRENWNFNAKSYMYANPRYATINTLDNQPWNNIEQILALTPLPELLIMTYDSSVVTTEKINTLEAANITVVMILELQSFLDPLFDQQVRLIGKVFGEEERAEQLLDYRDSVMADLTSRVSSVTTFPTAYIGAMSWAGTRPFTYSASVYDPFDLVSVNNVITNEITGGVQTPLNIAFETIVSLDPEYVFIDATGYQNVKTDYNGDPAKYSALSAFNTGDWKVFMSVPFIWYGVNFDNILVAAYHFGKVLYPTQFADVVLETKANEIYSMWVGYGCFGDMDAWFVANRTTHIYGVASF